MLAVKHHYLVFARTQRLSPLRGEAKASFWGLDILLPYSNNSQRIFAALLVEFLAVTFMPRFCFYEMSDTRDLHAHKRYQDHYATKLHQCRGIWFSVV